MNATKRAAMSVDIFGTTVTVTFANGKDLAIDTAKLTPEIQRAAMLHGIKQKLVDAAAIARNLDTGASASIDDKYAAVAEIHARLTGPNPSWNKAREPKATKVSKTDNGLLKEALMRMTGKNVEEIDAFLSLKSKAEREALKRNPRVLQIIAELQAATVTNGVDTDALLGELGASSGEESEESPADDLKALPPGNYTIPEEASVEVHRQAVVQVKPKRTRKATPAHA